MASDLITKNPLLVNIAEETFNENCKLFGNCLRGCKWAPDGSCIATNSEDHRVRIFNLPTRFCNTDEREDMKLQTWEPELKLREAQIIYDYCWYPLMTSVDSATCFILTTSREVPIHLWDAYCGRIQTSYWACNNVHELVSARSAAFTPDGTHIIAGYEKFICLFDVSKPGNSGQYLYDLPNGIVSCIAAGSGLFASGSYSKLIGIYDSNSPQCIATLQGHQGGVTHLALSSDGTRLYSGARKDNEILCWDLRNYGTILHIVKRSCHTNQRLYFDINFESNILATGDDDGQVHIYDLTLTPSEQEKVFNASNEWQAHDSCVNGSSLHPSLPLLATTSGQRGLLDFNDHEDLVFDYKKSYSKDTSLKLWWFR